MIQIEALFKVSYGLYIVSSGTRESGNGFVSNTVFQVSSSPAKFASCCSKENHSAALIQSTGSFSVSVLKQDASARLIGTFGYKSGADSDKMDGMDLTYGESGVPIVLNDAVAYLECKVVETFDVGSHLMFIGELIQAEVLNDEDLPLTYLHYREVKKGLAPKNAPTYVDKRAVGAAAESTSEADKPETTVETRRWECAACGHVYDEATEGQAFDELPDDWVCPVCGVEKEEFYEQ